MKSRLKALTQIITASKLDALLINSDTNIRYLTDFPASESWLLVTKSGKSYYITDSRYTLEAKAGLKGIVVKEYKKSFFTTLADLLRKNNCKHLGFDESHYTVTQYKGLKTKLAKVVQLRPANGFVEQLRVIKDDSEIKQIKEALKIHAKALKYLKKQVKPGVTEQDCLMKLEQYVKRAQVGFSFDPIIASGPNSCLPHAHVSRRKIKNNEPVLIDMGIDIKGYKSDLTRMFFLGRIPTLVAETCAIVSEAQRRAIIKIGPGVLASEVDQEARKYLKFFKLDKYFGHSLGHGVGLDIHEAPRLAPTSNTVLQPGMIITVEPGVYIPHKFGIRIEDMVLVTDKGYEILSDNID
ncbi:MAG: Xaa-Pro aminopeptidase [Candidatus Omnitrophota bacterium]